MLFFLLRCKGFTDRLTPPVALPTEQIGGSQIKSTKQRIDSMSKTDFSEMSVTHLNTLLTVSGVSNSREMIGKKWTKKALYVLALTLIDQQQNPEELTKEVSEALLQANLTSKSLRDTLIEIIDWEWRDYSFPEKAADRIILALAGVHQPACQCNECLARRAETADRLISNAPPAMPEDLRSAPQGKVNRDRVPLSQCRLIAVDPDGVELVLNKNLYFFEESGISDDSGMGHLDRYQLFIEPID
jgi:hypothetical protein